MSIYSSVKAVTELGEEKRCMACGEYWPSDQEFFHVMVSSRDGLTPRCIACIKDRLWQVARPNLVEERLRNTELPAYA